ncbi:MAG: hypothetical protein PQ612_10500 [Rickettsiales bacterium]|nr:hypothetical protein [Rickettsiales bacterium]MDG4548706.1 hypothetical protein [Rickettsiales bacterium]
MVECGIIVCYADLFLQTFAEEGKQMPRHDWFHHIKLSGTRHRREKDAMRKAVKRESHNNYKPKPTKKSSYYKIYKNRYKKLGIGNFKTHSYRLIDLANIYGIHVNTVLDWYNNDMLPKPFLKESDKYRSWGWQKRPIYIKEQILVITKVLDDVFAQSSQFRSNYEGHIEMMREGDFMVRERMSYKAVAIKTVKPVKPKTKLRKRPAPHLRPLLRAMQAELNKRSKNW